MKMFLQSMSPFLSWSLLLIGPQNSFTWQTDPPGSAQPPQAVEQSIPQLEQLVAPIALYPDTLIAQILPAATFPEQILEAEKWMAQHKDLSKDALTQEVDKQSWDPSVKALTQFPVVLANMNQNLAWTSELGDVYANQQEDLSKAVQTMRERARQAGNLNSTAQQKVNDKGNTIVIEPVEPDVVYVPQYDPWLVYGYPLAAFPGWYPYPGLYLDGPGIGFGLAFGLGPFRPYGWGWRHWRYHWGHGGRVFFNRNHYISHSRSIVNRNEFRPGGGNSDHGRVPRGAFDRPHGFHGNGATHVPPAGHSGAFGGFNHGGIVRGNASRGQSSSGGFRGGGGFDGGGGARGGHR
jgi:uncharacterized membrane protein YgcG